MKILLPLSFFLFTVFVSCRQNEDVTCDTGVFVFVGVGFSVADFNGATLSKYQPGTHFGKLLQSGNITYYPWVRGSVTSDSGSVPPPGALAKAHEPGALPTPYDYILRIPALGINDTISDVVFLGPTDKWMSVSDSHPAYCSNQMGSYKFNSQTVIHPTSGQIYLVK